MQSAVSKLSPFLIKSVMHFICFKFPLLYNKPDSVGKKTAP